MKLKRFICFVSMAALVGSMLIGCGSTNESANNQETAKVGEQVSNQDQASTEDQTPNQEPDEVDAVKETPRNETLYVFPGQWGAPANFNMLTGNPAFPCNQGRELIYETLFMYNQLTGQMEPLVGQSYEWAGQYTLKVKLNPDAKFNDGIPLTADDIVYSYQLGRKYQISWSNYWAYLDDVKAESTQIVVLLLNKQKYNRLSALDSLQDVPIHPKHIWSEIEKKANNNLSEIRKVFDENPVGSGPYKLMFYDDTKISLVRDDNYWGKSLFGKLPAPKYIVHPIYKANDAANLAFKNGQIDITQAFIPKVWLMWEDGAPIRTYLEQKPYFLPGSLPSIFFNMSKKGLDVPEVRRAIAMSIDYNKIADIAMSGYSADIEPALVLLNSDAEAKYVDKEALKPLMWQFDVAGANKLLDSIGAKKGPDGIRVLKDGTRLGPYDLECPYGWSDWNASLEIVAQCTKKIGIEMRTKFPEAPVVTNDRQMGKFDIIMNSPAGGLRPSQPWSRARYIMMSQGVPPIGELAFWNEGRYKNPRADEILNLIPQKADEKELKALYTELNMIYMKDIPSIPLMYRPWHFYTVNESVWRGFPREYYNPKNVPPQICMDGAGIKALYEIYSK